MSPSPAMLALRPLERLINGALVYDPGTRAAVAALAGQTAVVEVTLPTVAVAVAFTADGTVTLVPADGTAAADVRLAGNGMALARLMSRARDTYSFAGTGVVVTGDQELLRRLGAILEQLDIDWEQALAGVVGDSPAHLAGRAVRSAGDWLADVAGRSRSGAGEYLREESGLTVGDTEARPWFEGVRHLSADTERLAARVNRLRVLMDDSGRGGNHS